MKPDAGVRDGAHTLRSVVDAAVADDAEAVCSLLAPRLQPADVVLLKASRAEGLERMLPRLREAARALSPQADSQEVEG